MQTGSLGRTGRISRIQKRKEKIIIAHVTAASSHVDGVVCQGSDNRVRFPKKSPPVLK